MWNDMSKSELDSSLECVQNGMMVHLKHKSYHAFFCFVIFTPWMVNQLTHWHGDCGTNFTSPHECEMAIYAFCERQHGTRIQEKHTQWLIYSKCVQEKSCWNKSW